LAARKIGGAARDQCHVRHSTDDSQRAAMAAGIRDIRFSAMPTSYHMINFILPERCAAETMAFAESVETKRRR
jgi:hypothetical protein